MKNWNWRLILVVYVPLTIAFLFAWFFLWCNDIPWYLATIKLIVIIVLTYIFIMVDKYLGSWIDKGKKDYK